MVGATGAIGRELVAELVVSSKCGSLVAVTRRKLGGASSGTFPQEHVDTCFPALAEGGRCEAGVDLRKLEIAVVDWEDVCNSDRTHSFCDGAHFVACCLGTTRATREVRRFSPGVTWTIQPLRRRLPNERLHALFAGDVPGCIVFKLHLLHEDKGTAGGCGEGWSSRA